MSWFKRVKEGILTKTQDKKPTPDGLWHKCGECKEQLPAWFEVDHRVKLEYGGSNDVNNLEALCRDCHGKKTAMENL